MTKQKRLSVVRPRDTKLGRATIMDRGLAQRYGAPYVHLAAFAIDIDRVHRLDPDSKTLPFGWEVCLTEARLIRFMDEVATDPTALLEETCLSVMESSAPPGDTEGVLGAQLPFAIYTGVAHEHLPTALGACFRSWKKPPVHLIEEIGELLNTEGLVQRLAEHCLNAPIEPALVPPVRDALELLRKS